MERQKLEELKEEIDSILAAEAILCRRPAAD
jgi:hypothetical protein